MYGANTDLLKSQGSLTLFLTKGYRGGGLIITDKSSKRVSMISGLFFAILSMIFVIGTLISL